MGHLVITNVPIGGIDTDSEDASVEAIDCRDAVNIRNSYTYLNIEKTAGPVKGNVLVSYDLGNVKHKSLGTVEDKIGKSIVYFLWAEDNNHKILRYFIEKIENGQPYGTIENVITFDFGWTRHTSIHSADVVKGELLYWIDPVPRKINMTKAGLAFKQKSWTITLPTSYTVLPASFPITVKDYYTNANIAMITAYTTIGQTIKQAFESLATQINTGAISSYLEAETCGCTLQIKEKTANKYKFVWSATDYKVVADNWYGPNLKARYFDAAKWQPACQPNYEYAKDATKNYNFVKNNVWQYRIGYKYDDGESSALSPISQIAVNNEICNEGQREAYNVCVVDFNNTDIVDPDNWVIIKKVILYVRNRNAGAWRKVIALDPCEFYDVVGGVPTAKYVFDNLIQTQGVDEAFSALLYDRMPREADAQKFIEDHIVYGAPLDDYNTPDCGQLETTVVYEDIKQQEYFDISFIIRICNPYPGFFNAADKAAALNYQLGFSGYLENSVIGILQRTGFVTRTENSTSPGWGGVWADNIGANQAGYLQDMPEGGFLVYLSGTPFYAISRQVVRDGGSLKKDEFGAVMIGTGSGTDADALNNFIKEDSDDIVYQQVTIKRVPKGKYVVRLASHLCSFGDKLNRGKVYDINNNLYNLTSTNVFRINDPNGVKIGTSEVTIDVTQDEYFGEIYVSDGMIGNIDSLNTGRYVFGYLIDANLLNVVTQTQQVKCLGIEKQTIVLTPGAYGPGHEQDLPGPINSGSATYTDHNGYFFFIFNSGSALTSVHLTAIGAGNFFISEWDATKYYGHIGDVYNNALVAISTQDAFGSAAANQYFLQATQPSLDGAVNVTQLIRAVIINVQQGKEYTRDYSTFIKGRIIDNLGLPICCCGIVYEGTSRFDNSRDDGTWEIRVYAEGRHNITLNGSALVNPKPISLASNPDKVRNDNLLFNSGECLAQFVPDKLLVFISPFGLNATIVAPPYSSTAWIDVGDIIASVLSARLIKAPKRGSKYLLSMRFQDAAGRLCTCVPLGELFIPFITENGVSGYPVVSWNIPIGFKPPKWAHHYQFMRSENLFTADYFQWLVNDVKYVFSVLADGTAVETTYENFDATQIWISVENLSDYFRQNPNSQVGYVFQEDQKMRFIYDEKNQIINQYADFDIIGYDSTGQWIKIKYNQTLGQIKTGWRYEVYRKRKILSDEIYFECGECFPTTAPDTDVNDFSLRNGVFTWGDTYWVKRSIPIRDLTDIVFSAQVIYFMESQGVNDFFPSTDQDIGRVGDVDENFGEVRRTNYLRISDNYATRDNGLSAFRNIDDRVLDLTYGPIRKLAASGFILLAVCENRTVSNYIGRVVVKSSEGETLQALTGQFLGDTRPLQQELGTQNPETIKEFDGYVYGFDARRGVLWRYAGNGQIEISTQGKMRSFFSYYQRNGVWFAPAVIDRLYKEYIITIFDKRDISGSYGPGNAGLHNVTINKDITEYVKVADEVYLSYRKNGEAKTGYFIVGSLDTVNGGLTYQVGFNLDADANSGVTIYYRGEGRTISFCELKNKFSTRYSFMPDSYGSIDKDIVSIKDGKLWIHDKNEVHNNFYGVQYTSQLKPIFNENASVKLWLAISINAKQADGKSNWSCPVVTNKNGQLSRVKNNLFKKKEEYFHSEFKFDINTPGGGPNAILNGKNLRSSTLTVLMENDYTGDFDLRSVFVGVEISERNTN